MRKNNAPDPGEKNNIPDQPLQRQENEEGVFLVNDDGTEFDSSERTYVSVDLPEEEDKIENADDSGE